MSTSESSEDVGTFASGQDDPRAHPEDETVGTFADRETRDDTSTGARTARRPSPPASGREERVSRN